MEGTSSNPMPKVPEFVHVAAATAPKLKSVVIGPSLASDPMVTVVPSLIKKVLNFIPICPSPVFLRWLNLLVIDPNTTVPSYFSNNHILIHLAIILYPQLDVNALEKLALLYSEEEDEDEDPELVVQYDGEDEMMAQDEAVPVETEGEKDKPKEDSDLEMLESPPPMFMTQGKKKKTVKALEQLEDSFLRRSKRVSGRLGGIKDKQSAKKFEVQQAQKSEKKPTRPKKGKKPKKGSKTKKQDVDSEVPEEPVPLAVIPPAPYLTKDIPERIGEGFLQIQPMVVSVALLDADDLDE